MKQNKINRFGFLILFLLLTNSYKIVAQKNNFTIGGYGEVIYQHYNYGPNQNRPTGSEADSRAIMDVPRFVLEFGYFLSDDIEFKTEIEFEHLGTGAEIELEYEEFGEYEAEIGKGGEVVLEQFHITKTFSEAIKLRVGHFILGFGLLNKAHLPIQYFGTIRPEAETAFLPSTWHETGIELFGKYSNFSYRMQLVNGLDATGFSSQYWVKKGNQKVFEKVRATNLAIVGRIDYKGIDGLQIGASGYYGNSTGNRPKKSDMKGIDAHVGIAETHFTLNANSIIARGTFIYGNLQNADIVSRKNIHLARNLPVPRTPVAKNAMAWGVEAGFEMLKTFSVKSNYKLYPFLRYEFYNTMHKVNRGVFAVPRYKRNILTFGANFFPLPNLVIKADYSIRTVGNSTFNKEHTFGLAIGFASWFFKNY